MKPLMLSVLTVGILISVQSRAHNMPDEAKKAALIEIMIQNELPLSNVTQYELSNGDFQTSFAYEHLIPMVNFFEWGYTGYEQRGDQDLEAMNFTFKHNEVDYNLNCLLNSEELLSKDRVKYTLKPRYCVLSGKGTSQDISIPNAVVFRDFPY